MFTISFLILFLIEREVRLTKVEELQIQEQRVVALEDSLLGREFNMVLSDLHYLNEAFKAQLNNPENYNEVAENWKVFATQRMIYDQIRFLDVSGNEKIRININDDGGYVVGVDSLQNKADRYYFTKTIDLGDGSVYISPLDLNVEQGSIETPYKPMIRVSSPLYDEQGVKQGIIVLNYLAQYTLTNFRDLASNSLGEVMLINSSGYRLSSINPENDWNFMFDEKKEDTFAKEYPSEWEMIKNNQKQFLTENGLVTTVPVILSNKYNTYNIKQHEENLSFGDGNWYVVSLVERNKENASYFIDNGWAFTADVLERNIFYFLLIFIISGIVGLLVYINRKTYSRIKYYSRYDSLTKSLNRRAGIEKLNELLPSDNRRSALVSLCFIDINGLKQVNDTFGHSLGDELIKTVADVIQETIRDEDFLVRLGGDEFLIVLLDTEINKVDIVWERIITKYKKINKNETRPYLISVSHGVVHFDNKKMVDVDDLINEADEKMYQEKQIIKETLDVIRKDGE